MARVQKRVARAIVVSVLAWSVLSSSAMASGAAAKEGAPEAEKATVMRQVGQEWVKVGISQFKRGLFDAAEKSFVTASGYEEYLSVPERKELSDWLEKTHKAAAEREIVLEHVRKAGDLVNKGEPIKARAHYEKVRNSTYLTEQERKQIAEQLRNIDEHFDSQKKEITEVYNRSVELYRAGELDRAREGFLEVSRYGLLVTAKGQSPEDYLVEIDGILTERLRNMLPLQNARDANRMAERRRGDIGVDVVEVAAAAEANEQGQPAEPNEQKGEVLVAAEPAARPGDDAKGEQEKKARVVRSYVGAVVKDLEGKVDEYISKGEMSKAVEAVRAAAELVRDRREHLGEDLFAEFSVRLRQLADRIIQVQDGQGRR